MATAIPERRGTERRRQGNLPSHFFYYQFLFCFLILFYFAVSSGIVVLVAVVVVLDTKWANGEPSKIDDQSDTHTQENCVEDYYIAPANHRVQPTSTNANYNLHCKSQVFGTHALVCATHLKRLTDHNNGGGVGMNRERKISMITSSFLTS